MSQGKDSMSNRSSKIHHDVAGESREMMDLNRTLVLEA
jgi:hypothetical protein